MARILSIGTAVPRYRHAQQDILQFVQLVYACSDAERRKLRFLYNQSGIGQRFSVLPDFSLAAPDWTFFPQTENLEPFPSLEQRMEVFHREAPALAVAAIRDCLKTDHSVSEVTHLITVSCTGLSAPGLDLRVAEALQLPPQVFRTSVNFMGCYAAIHALKIGQTLCSADQNARVLIVCAELCTLHFQREATLDNIASSLLFGDGASAVLLAPDSASDGLQLTGFYSEVVPKGKGDMAWALSSTGFLMTLSAYVPDIIEEDFNAIVTRVAAASGMAHTPIRKWCLHPGGRRILEAVEKSVGLEKEALAPSYRVLQQYGNMSSATILFVLKEWMEAGGEGPLLGAAFGSGLTVETFTAA